MSAKPTKPLGCFMQLLALIFIVVAIMKWPESQAEAVTYAIFGAAALAYGGWAVR